MKIKRARISGYSAFEDTGWFDLSPSINIVAGKNNSGKSSLLRAVAMRELDSPHRNRDNYLPGNLKKPTVEIDFQTSHSEFRERLKTTGQQVTVQTGGPSVADQAWLKTYVELDEELELRCQRIGKQNITMRKPLLPKSPNYSNNYRSNLIYDGGELIVTGAGTGTGDSSYIAFFERDSKIFYFPAERYHKSRSPLQRNEILLGDASNLAGFLQYLQGNNNAKYVEIVERLGQIIPAIEDISIDTHNDGFEILVWHRGSQGNRSLAVPLSECGSGVSQTLAIFACVCTRRDSMIVVDEINSFLHPLAAKDLISVLASEYPSHQYVISSHSSEVISHPSVSTVLNVEKGDKSSTVSVISRSDVDELRDGLRELGVSMSDVLGSDYFLWVEGPTEVVALPSLYRKHIGKFPVSIRLASVDATGDFSKKKSDSRTVVRLYDYVSKIAAPLSKGQAFLLDKEGYQQGTIDQHRASTDGRLAYITRRCLENYALDPEAIASVLNDELSGEKLESKKIEEIIKKCASASEIVGWRRFSGDIGDPDWLVEVDGAKLLKAVFAEASDNRVEFRKVLHTPQILALRKRKDLESLIESIDERVSFLGVHTVVKPAR